VERTSVTPSLSVRQLLAPSTQQVRIAGHTFNSKHHPTLECDLDDVKVFELELDLDLSLHFAGVVLTIARGEITSLALGDATVAASLKTASGVTLIPEQQMIVVFSQSLTKAPAPQQPTPPEHAVAPSDQLASIQTHGTISSRWPQSAPHSWSSNCMPCRVR
jgi:hypothetical protein